MFLKCHDPEAYEMVLKINLLTKMVVDRTNEVKEMSKQLQQQEDMYVEVRRSMENCPGLELPEEVVYFQHLLRAKRQQLILLEHELETSEAERSHYQKLTGELKQRLDDMKVEYFKRLANPGKKARDVVSAGSFIGEVSTC